MRSTKAAHLTDNRAIEQILSRLGRLEGTVLSWSILLMAGLASVNIFCRSILGFSLAMTEELIQFCVIVVCFVGLSYAAGQGRHIRMTAIYDQLSQRNRRLMMCGIAACTAGLFVGLTYYAGRYVYVVFQLGGTYPATRVPFWVVYAVAPLGLALTAVQFLVTAMRNFSQGEVYLSPTVRDCRDQPSSTGPTDAATPPRGESPC